MESNYTPLSFSDVQTAATRIAHQVRRTPVVRSSTLDRAVRAEVLFKCENFQRSGAFKFRGASNAVLSLDPEVAAAGVVTHSSGNHAAALALAAQLRGIPARIVIPEGASRAKLASVERYGGQVTRCAASLADREAAAQRLLAKHGGTLVHPFDDALVMAGQGTAALELLAEVPELDALVVPLSGGGLLGGCAVAAQGVRRGIHVVGVEPTGADDAVRSLSQGRIVREPTPATICDGLRAFLSPRTFAAIRDTGATVVTATDAEAIRAMRLIWDVLKIVVEPSSAIALAAVLESRIALPTGAKIGIILTGGNVDLDALPWH